MSKCENFVELPEFLWSFVLNSMFFKLAETVNRHRAVDTQIWSIIPNEEREWIDIDALECSNVLRLKNLIGLDFNTKAPIIGDGQFWIAKIRDSIRQDLSLETRNIYVTNSQMTLFLFYIEGNGILIYGSSKSVIFKP